MYSINEILSPLLCFIIIFNSTPIIYYLQKIFIVFNVNYEEKIKNFIKFYKFISENNLFFMNYEFDSSDILPELEEIKEENKYKIDKVEFRYEDKYIDKFKQFPNVYQFNDIEVEKENEEYIKIKLEYEKNRYETINTINTQLSKIFDIQKKGNIDYTKENYTENINSIGIKLLLNFFDIDEEEYNECPDDFDLEELYQDLLKNKESLLKKKEEAEKTEMTDEDMHKKAKEIIINQKLDKFIDNYILEHTPLGNIYMRYNNNKKSFEYFSNNSIPYRYLEPVGRKYVMTYWCKPIFVDIDDELKKAEERYEEEKKKKEEEDKKLEEDRKNNPRKILAQLKNYNKESKDITMRPMKNRANKNAVLPPQIKANLPDVNKPTEKQLLKENANRYTWEGRLTNFCPLKKIDRKILDKKLSMTYSDFKKMYKK